MHYNPSSQEWDLVKEIPYMIDGNRMELSLNRKDIGLSGDNFVFDFKWADNPADLNDIISLCTNGDTAPNRRFNYRFIWSK